MGNQSDQAVEQLQRMIEHGELRPGSMVSERGLMELTGLGRTPVREAIQRLAMTRMLHVHPSKGIEVPAVSVEDQLNGLEVRRTLESLVDGKSIMSVMMLAAGKGSSIQLQTDGEQEAEAMQGLIELINNRFDEAE